MFVDVAVDMGFLAGLLPVCLCSSFSLLVPVSVFLSMWPQLPPGPFPDGAKGGDGLGVDGHHLVSVLVDLRGGRLRPLLCFEVLEGV